MGKIRIIAGSIEQLKIKVARFCSKHQVKDVFIGDNSADITYYF